MRSRLGALVLSAVTAVSVLTACGADSEEGGACPLVLEFDGQDYLGSPADGALPEAKQIGTGDLPGCSDDNDSAAGTEHVEVWRLPGLEPTVAVAARLGGELQLFVAEDQADVCGLRYTRCEGAG
jgi:hypothetical protein